MAVISEFTAAVNQICSERGIDPDKVYSALESAILAAYKKDYKDAENLSAELNRETGEVQIIASKEVVDAEDVEDPDLQISMDQAREVASNVELGDHIEMEVQVEGFGRIAAQTAKQVILQSIRESEKEAVISEFEDQIGTVVSGLVQRMMGPTAVVELGKTVAYMPPEEQIPNEFYRIGERYKFYLKEIKDDQQMIVSRGSSDFLVELFKLEVPEIESNVVEIKACAREAGSRSKVAVTSHQEGIDPIGSCVGQKGVRIANIMSELGEEKIDIIEWDEDLETFVANALGPAQVDNVEIPEDGLAIVHVPDDQLSLAIGKDGQNVRLAAKLTEMKIDISAPSLENSENLTSDSEGEASEESGSNEELSSRLMALLESSGVSLEDLPNMEESQIREIKGIGDKYYEEIQNYLNGLEELVTKEDSDVAEESENVQEEASKGEDVESDELVEDKDDSSEE